jgi:aspartyl-tRNA(Asn)/glutamyl-tRNA(Gln) amidotransferase subunit A
MGLTDGGLPLGLQIMGPRFHDARCIAAAAQMEAILPWPRLAPLDM